MSQEILFFLLGYPLSILANINTDYLKSKFEHHSALPLKDLFINAFLNSLKTNKGKVDIIGQNAIETVEKIISKDKEKLFQILDDCMGADNSKVFELRSDELKNQMANAILKEFNMNHISLAKSVIVDCLNQYEVSFFTELTEKEGINFLINNLKKLNSEVAKQEDIEKLREFLVETLSLQKSEESVISNEVRELFYEEISNPVSQFFSEPIVDYMASLKKKVEQLTADQYQVIHNLRYKNRVIISGCAGSGKTLLAAEKAIRLDQAGIKTLILCHNPHLANYIQNLVSDTSVQVNDITSFVNSLSNEVESKNENWNEYIEPLDEDIEIAFDRVNSNSHPLFEAIIVDEGQDFKELWWLLIEAILDKSKNKILYIFFDDNQALLPFRSKYPIEDSPISMSKNCRNGGNIFEIVKKFHPHSPLISQFLTKDGVAKITVFDENNWKVKLGEALQDVYKYTSHYQISVITNEASVENSPISNFTFIKYPDLHWRLTVLKDLTHARKRLLERIERLRSASSISETANRFGFSVNDNLEEFYKLPTLSYNLLPTKEDVDAVCKYARKLFPHFEGEVNIYVQFAVENGRLCLMAKKPPHYRQLIGATPNSKLNFYSNQYWADSLPSIKSFSKIVPYTIYSSLDDYAIPLYSVDLFKGLESDAIILFINTVNSDLEKEMYVGSSRAIGYLNIVISKSVLAKIKRLDDRSFYV